VRSLQGRAREFAAHLNSLWPKLGRRARQRDDAAALAADTVAAASKSESGAPADAALVSLAGTAVAAPTNASLAGTADSQPTKSQNVATANVAPALEEGTPAADGRGGTVHGGPEEAVRDQGAVRERTETRSILEGRIPRPRAPAPDQRRSTLLAPRGGFVVPGGRFREVKRLVFSFSFF